MKVTLLGDSIRQQYEHRVRELLRDTFDVWAPRENCRFSQYTLRCLFDWAEHMDGSEIVHWNNGHWDVCRLFGDGTFSDEDDYVKNMLRIIDVLQKKHCLVIFATTTPVRSANMYNKNEDIDRFNRRIVPLLRARGAIVNDLNGFLRADVEKYICKDTIHLSEAGIDLCAEYVATCIREVAKTISYTTECNESKIGELCQKHTGAPILL